MHHPSVDRREFLKSTAASCAVASLAGGPAAAAQQSAQDSKPFKKAVKYGMVQGDMPVMDKFKLLKELGFDGVEPNRPDDKVSRDEMLQAQEATGIKIHGVVDALHWSDPLSDPSPEVRRRGVEGLKAALHDAKFFGASTVLVVPAVVNKEVSYDQAYERSQAGIREVLPLAAELGIKIALENVWNQFLLSPLETAQYIDSFGSPMIGAYFDVGNVVNYGWPEHWIRILGKRVLKLDIKEYSRKLRDEQGPRQGFRVELLEGDCDWPAVMQAVREIGYTGWGTAEIPGGDRARLADIAARMDRIFAS
ncbi:MAG: sugar phosphate isomerase/epimerase [Planctomycetes bacterium]|nr:sugar phosphate isomerase/epimerase [Planctomycetota bacterium]